MGFIFPYSSTMRVIGGMILLSTLVNTLLTLRSAELWDHPLYSQWYFDWSPLFLFIGVLLVTGSLWQDPRIVIVVSAILATLWYVFIVLGWSL